MSDNWSTHKTIKAKTAHRCDGCHGAIGPGMTYRKDVGCYDGDFYVVKMHHECRSLWEDIWTETKEYGDTMDPFIPEELSDLPNDDPFIDQYNDIAGKHGGHVYETA